MKHNFNTIPIKIKDSRIKELILAFPRSRAPMRPASSLQSIRIELADSSPARSGKGYMGSTGFDTRCLLGEKEVRIMHTQADLVAPLSQKPVPKRL
jgi:hypothetical protein